MVIKNVNLKYQTSIFFSHTSQTAKKKIIFFGKGFRTEFKALVLNA